MGAKVYAGDRDPGPGSDDDLVSAKNLLGRTPLVLGFRPRYLAFGSDYDFAKLPGFSNWMNLRDAFLDVTATSFRRGLRQNESGRFYIEAIHIYEPDFARANTLIALFQPRDLSLEELAPLYPKGKNFQFDEAPLRKTLLESGVSQEQITGAFELLRRGGKVALQGRAGTLVVEITRSGATTTSKVK